MMSRLTASIEDALIRSVDQFQRDHPDDTIYGVALVMSFTGMYMHAAIASENGLSSVAERYLQRGYRYNGVSDADAVRTWLRWANPDDGWHQDTHKSFAATCELLANMIGNGDIDEGDDRIGSAARQALKNFVPSTLGGDVVIGTTYGEDPEDFRYWAGKLNEQQSVARFEREFENARRIEGSIHR